MRTIREQLSLVAMALSLLASAACGDDDDDDDDSGEDAGPVEDAGPGVDAGGDLDAGGDVDGGDRDAGADAGVDCEVHPELCPADIFALDVEVRAPGGAAQASYMQAIDRAMFDERAITNDAAIEVEGIGRLFTLGGRMYVGQRTAPTLNAYEVGEDLALEDAGAVSFLGQGADRIDIGLVLVSPTKAYYLIGPTLTAAIFNPTTMEIEGSFDIAAAQRKGFEGAVLFQGLFLFEHAVQGNRAFVSTLHSINAQSLYYPNMTVTVLDTENDAFLKVIEDDRCYGPSTMIKDTNGDIYVSSYSFSGGIYAVEGQEYKPTCILRILAGEDEFDPDYFQSFPELLDGRECTRWYPVDARYSYGMAIPLETLQNAPNASQAEGEVWRIDLVEQTAERVEELAPSSAFETLAYPDRPDAIILGTTAVRGTYDRSLVYRLVPSERTVTPIFEVGGLFRGLYPVR